MGRERDMGITNRESMGKTLWELWSKWNGKSCRILSKLHGKPNWNSVDWRFWRWSWLRKVTKKTPWSRLKQLDNDSINSKKNEKRNQGCTDRCIIKFGIEKLSFIYLDWCQRSSSRKRWYWIYGIFKKPNWKYL